MVTSPTPAHPSPARRRGRLTARGSVANPLGAVCSGREGRADKAGPAPDPSPPPGPAVGSGGWRRTEPPTAPRPPPAPGAVGALPRSLPTGRRRGWAHGKGTCGGGRPFLPSIPPPTSPASPGPGLLRRYRDLRCHMLDGSAERSPSEPEQLLPQPYLTRLIIPGSRSPSSSPPPLSF